MLPSTHRACWLLSHGIRDPAKCQPAQCVVARRASAHGSTASLTNIIHTQTADHQTAICTNDIGGCRVTTPTRSNNY